MQKLELSISTLFGDHHATAVRNLLSQIQGVGEFLVSTGMHHVMVTYDPNVVKKEAIEKALKESGYESDGEKVKNTVSTMQRPTRHTAAFSGIGDTLSFAENASWEGRALWPCPGFDMKPTMDKG